MIRLNRLKAGLAPPRLCGNQPCFKVGMLDELAKELERRKHCFVRYADDCPLCSQRACGRTGDGQRRTLPRQASEAEGQDTEERGSA